MSHIENKESGSKNKYDFDAWRNTGTLVGAMDYMLREFYFGEYASEIWHCFRMSDKYQPSYRFCWNPLVRGTKEIQVSGYILTDEEQIHADFCADKDRVMVNYLLQLHHVGKSNSRVQSRLNSEFYHLSEEIIQELITISEKRPMRHDFCEENQGWQEELLPPLPFDTRYEDYNHSKRFVRGLVPMLQKFIYFGESTEETRLVFLNLKRGFFSSFIQDCTIEIHDEVIPRITRVMACSIILLKFILQLHHLGKDARFILMNVIKHFPFFFWSQNEFVQEIIDIAKEPDEGDLMRHKLREACSEKESDQKNDGE